MTPEARRATTGLWIALAILLAVVAATYELRLTVAERTGWVETTHEVIEHLFAERAALIEVRSLSHAYALTGDDADLAGYPAAVLTLEASVDAVRALTVDDASAQRRIDWIEPRVREQIASSGAVIERRGRGAPDPDDTRGKRAPEVPILSSLAAMIADERLLLAERKRGADAAIKRLVVIQRAGLLVSVGLLLLAFGRLWRETRRRSLSEETARRAEESLASILMSIGDGVIATDLTGRVIRMNKVTEELTGWTAAAGVGMLASEIFRINDAETREPIPDPVERVLRLGAPVGVGRPWLLTRKDGIETPVSDSCAPIRDDHGVVQGAVLVFRDVTESQRAKTFFRALVEQSSDGITLATTDGTLTYASPAAARMLGRTVEALVGTGVVDYADPRDLATAREDNRKFVESAGPFVAPERRIERPDGTFCWVEVTGTNMVGDPAVGAVVRNMRDVTAEKRAGGALRASEERFARLSECGLVGIALADLEGHVRDANDAYCALLGYSREDLEAGRIAWGSMTPPEWASLDDRAAERLASVGVAKPWEKELFRKDGSRAQVLIGAAMLGERECLVFIADLSDQKRSERALRETEAQLRQAQKMDAVGRLAGGVAHDFNNMLSVIVSYAELLLADAMPNDPMHADLGEILKAGLRAADLTGQLLMFSRQQVIEPRVVDPNEVLTDMERMLERLLGEDIDFTLTRRSTGKILVDPSGIAHVVMNLVVNARDAMATGGKLTIETADVLLDEEYARHHIGVSSGAHVMLAVTDSGAGMDAATRERIFEPFFTTKQTGKGTGLGLSTVFGIVTQSRGSIWVYSEPGIGTTFKVYFPLANADARRTKSGPLRLCAVPSTPHGTETILLVEDEGQLRKLARGILTRCGYKVLDVGSPGEALLASEQYADTIHLLLTDVVMPQMSGPQLARRLASVRPLMKVLCMSGYTDDSVVRHGVLEARFAFLQKPITPDALARKVRETLDESP